MGIGALICAFLCAFFLREPQNSFGLDAVTETQPQPQPIQIPSSEFGIRD
jgi:hypothetical protein